MNPIVFALRRPLTVLVAIVAVGLSCSLALRPKNCDAWLAKYGIELPLKRMAVDNFPFLTLPVIYVCQPYQRVEKLARREDRGQVTRAERSRGMALRTLLVGPSRAE